MLNRNDSARQIAREERIRRISHRRHEWGNVVAVLETTVDDNAVLTVERRDPSDVRIRQLVVTLDGDPFATLLFGQVATRSISAGPHRLRVHNTLVWRNVAFDASHGEHVRFVAVNRAGPGSMTLIALLGAGPLYVTLERRGADEHDAHDKDGVNGRA